MRRAHAQSPMHGLRIIEHLLQIIDGPAGNAGRAQLLQPVIDAVRLEDRVEHLGDFVPVLHPFDIGVETGIVLQFGMTDRVAQREILLVVARRDHDGAVAAREHAGRHAAIALRAPAHRHLARSEVDLRIMRQRRHAAIQQGDVDILALAAGGVAMIQGRQYGIGDVQPGEQVDDAGADLHRSGARLALRHAGDAHEAALALEHRVIAGLSRQRPVLAISGDGAVDDAGIDGLQAFIVEAIALEIADLVILHHHVAGLDEFADQFLPLRAGDVEGDRSLVAVDGHVEGIFPRRLPLRIAQIGFAENAGIVAHHGAFDLDHVRAHVGQDLRPERPRQNAGQVKHADLFKGQSGHGSPC